MSAVRSALTLFAIGSVLLSTAPASAQTGNALFAADSFWKTPLAAPYVADLKRQVTTYGTWINPREHSAPVYTVPSDQPTVRVKLDNVQTLLQAAGEAVPIPPEAKPAAGTDRTMTIYQPSTDT